MEHGNSPDYQLRRNELFTSRFLLFVCLKEMFRPSSKAQGIRSSWLLQTQDRRLEILTVWQVQYLQTVWTSNLRAVGVCKERGSEDWLLGNLGGKQTFSGKTYNEHEPFTTQIRAMWQPHVSVAWIQERQQFPSTVKQKMMDRNRNTATVRALVSHWVDGMTLLPIISEIPWWLSFCMWHMRKYANEVEDAGGSTVCHEGCAVKVVLAPRVHNKPEVAS